MQPAKRNTLLLPPRPKHLIGALVLLFFVGFAGIKLADWVRTRNTGSSGGTGDLTESTGALKKTNGRTNVLFMGIAGGTHEGSDLTDTMLLASFNPETQDVVLLSIPRDIWLPSLQYRINQAYHVGEEKKPGGGMIVAKAAAKEVLGVDVHYGVIVDFSDFRELIDQVGGVDITIERSFEDTLYPLPGKENDPCDGDPAFACRYEVLQFQKGIEHMDGERALKYVRSRQSQSSEGTDFARGKRQQQVLVAIKEKVTHTSWWTNPLQLKDTLMIFGKSVQTDMGWTEKLLFINMLKNLETSAIRRVVLDAGDEKNGTPGLLVNPPRQQYNGAWVLVPRKETFDEIHQYVSCHTENPQCTMTP